VQSDVYSCGEWVCSRMYSLRSSKLLVHMSYIGLSTRYSYSSVVQAINSPYMSAHIPCDQCPLQCPMCMSFAVPCVCTRYLLHVHRSKHVCVV
jgi:hypothetical protein